MRSTWRRFSQQFRSPIWTVPLALLGVCALSYGSMASRMGIYQDDWFITFFRHYLGPSSLVEAFAIDRPLLGWMHWATTGLVGESLLSWQLFGIFTRWLSCLALWWALRGLWTQKDLEVTAVVMLFAVYPGFQQQYIAITYSSGFIVLAAFLASLGSMLWALRRPRWFWFLYLGSLALDGFGMFAAEYFFGLELLRPLMLWLVLGEEKGDLRKRLVRVFLYWIPYLFLMLIFLAWRVSTPTPRGTIDVFSKLSTGSFGAALDLAKMVLQNVYMASLLAWSRVFSLGILRAYGPPAILKYALVVLGTGCLVFIVLVFLRARREPEQDGLTEPWTGWSIMAFLLGLCALLAGGLPVWMTNLHMDLEYPWDRLTLPMMLGVSLLFGSLLLLIPRWRLLSYGSLAVAVGLAAGLHYQSALSYRRTGDSVSSAGKCPSARPLS